MIGPAAVNLTFEPSDTLPVGIGAHPDRTSSSDSFSFERIRDHTCR